MSDYVSKTVIRTPIYNSVKELDEFLDNHKWSSFMGLSYHVGCNSDEWPTSIYLEFILDYEYGVSGADSFEHIDIPKDLMSKILPYFKEFDENISEEDLTAWNYVYYNSSSPNNFDLSDVENKSKMLESYFDKIIEKSTNKEG